MKDVWIEGHKVFFTKKMFHETELLLAKCFNFEISKELDLITADITKTSQRSLFEFTRIAFRTFSEALHEEDRRNLLFGQVQDVYVKLRELSDKLGAERLPYYNSLFEHQKDALCQTMFKKSNLLAMDMGTGKTITAASITRFHKIPRTLIICPSIVKWNWYRDLVKFGFNPLSFTIYDAAKRKMMTSLTERFVIINFDILAKYHDEIIKEGIQHFIIDECHNIKSTSTNKFKNTKKIIDIFPDAKITLLSGTPIKNRVDDLFAYLKITKHPLGSSYTKFINEYTVNSFSRGFTRVTGAKNLQDLELKLSNFMIVKKKEDCLDLPDKIYMSYKFEMDDYRKEYDRIIEELSQKKEISSLTGNIHSLNIITSKAKINGIKKIIDNILNEDKKVVVFGSYKEPLNDLEKHLGNRCVKIDGSVDSKERDVRIQRFLEDENCTVFLGNMAAAGVGINLVNASDVVFINFPLTPAELNQAIDRCHRIGQDNSVNIHYTFCEDSIDEYIYDIIVDKETDTNQIMDKGKDVLTRNDMTQLLINKLLKRDGEQLPESTSDVESEADRVFN